MVTRVQLAAWTTALAAMLSLASEAAAWLPGFPPMPSNCAQWWGYGYGPGLLTPLPTSPAAAPDPALCCSVATGGCGLTCPAPYAPIGCYGNGCHCEATGGQAGYWPGAGPVIYSQPQPTMAPPPAAAQRDDSFTWR